MPKQNPSRSIAAGERNLAQRIAMERTQVHSWSYEQLAREMAAVGCPIQASAIFRIEKGTPPRRVTVDELIAFAEVFGESVEKLLQPIDELNRRHALELVEKLGTSSDSLQVAVVSLVDAWCAFADYFRDHSQSDDGREMMQFVEGHLSRKKPSDLPRRVRAELDYVAKAGDYVSVEVVEKAVNTLVAAAQSIGLKRAWPHLNALKAD